MESYTFPSKSNPDKTYKAGVEGDGKLVCDCMGWLTARGVRHCTHTKQIAGKRPVTFQGQFAYVGFTTNAERPVPPEDVVGALAPTPMLASAMIDPVKGADFEARYTPNEWVMEEKIDGHRVLVVVVGGTVIAYSRPRAGEKPKLRELQPQLLKAFSKLPTGLYDGELWVEGGKAWNVAERGAKHVYVAFDVLALEGKETIGLSYLDRRYLLDTALRKGPSESPVYALPALLPNWSTIEDIWERDGEGVILKRKDSLYRPGARSPNWVKVKLLEAAELAIIGFKPGKGGPYSTILLRDDEGIETAIKTVNNKLLREIDKDPDSFLGRRLVIAYNGRTESTYRHPRFDHWVK